MPETKEIEKKAKISSGINEIKKKAKLSIDEMYDSQSVGKLDNQQDGKQENKQTIQPSIQLESNPEVHSNGSPSFQQVSQSFGHKAGQPAIQENGNMENNPNVKQGIQTSRNIPSFLMSKQQVLKTPTYKMTFNLTEEIYKAFNDLYANRMLQGRKTEKSDMICEAIQWLIKMEEQQ